MQLPPLSLYVHLPWCPRKCPYCDFNSHAAPEELPETAYIEALIAEFDHRRAQVQGRPIESLFFGGGSPSLFSARAIDAFLRQLDDRVRWSDGAEITLEANPGTVDQARFAGFRAAGVNRISIGAQSFDERLLRALGRIHGAREARDAIAAAGRAGFDAINADLMYGLPGQTALEALDDLNQALALGVSHLSWYELTIEPNTAFFSKPPTLPHEEELATIEERGRARLAAAGYHRYEISAFAPPGAECRHNLNYWHFGDYLGLGAGAHSKITREDQGTVAIVREWNTRMPDAYLASSAHPVAGRRVLEPAQLPLEFMMNALRLSDGATSEEFERRTGLSREALTTALAKLRAEGLLAEGEPLRTTPLGSRYLNGVLQAF